MMQLAQLAPYAIGVAYAAAVSLNLVTLQTQHIIWRRRGMALAAVAWASQFLWLLSHLALATPPLRQLQASEVTILLGWLIVGLSLGLCALWEEGTLAVTPMVVGVASIWIGLLLPYSTGPLSQDLASPLLPLHVGTSLLAYASFAAASAASALWVVQKVALRTTSWLPWALRLPSLQTIEKFVTTCVAGGLPLIGLSMSTGIVWAFHYPGDLTGWLPKVGATAIVALGYVAYLALGVLPRTSAYRPVVAMAGFVTLLTSLLALPLLGPGLHNFLYR
jgi:ABC-type uncharacterized transport system permease subunit